MKDKGFSRRSALKAMGAVGASSLFGAETIAGEQKPFEYADTKGGLSDVRKAIQKRVFQTPFIDTHEHLPEEKERLAGEGHPRLKSDDWTVLFSLGLSADMEMAGMPRAVKDKFFSPGVDPLEKWKLLEPYWPFIKNDGYGLTLRRTIKQLYDVDDLSNDTIKKVQEGYKKIRKPGFYDHILRELSNIESCQIDTQIPPFVESDMPAFLMHDIDITAMVDMRDIAAVSKPVGINVLSLSDWHKVIDWWFDKYGRYAVAVKSANAYKRDIDFERVAAEKVEGIFKKRLDGQVISESDKKVLEDHIFWYTVDKATDLNLPVKIHTGYLSEVNMMPLGRVAKNPDSASRLCNMQKDKGTRFVFFHIGYPFYESMIALAKHYTNAYIEMSFSWFINPVGAKDFLKKFLVCVPSNKIFTFGGDLRAVEMVFGHSVLARQGITLALSELVEEGWINLDDALNVIEPVMRGNAHKVFSLAQKYEILKNVKWA